MIGLKPYRKSNDCIEFEYDTGINMTNVIVPFETEIILMNDENITYQLREQKLLSSIDNIFERITFNINGCSIRYEKKNILEVISTDINHASNLSLLKIRGKLSSLKMLKQIDNIQYIRVILNTNINVLFQILFIETTENKLEKEISQSKGQTVFCDTVDILENFTYNYKSQVYRFNQNKIEAKLYCKNKKIKLENFTYEYVNGQLKYSVDITSPETTNVELMLVCEYDIFFYTKDNKINWFSLVSDDDYEHIKDKLN